MCGSAWERKCNDVIIIPPHPTPTPWRMCGSAWQKAQQRSNDVCVEAHANASAMTLLSHPSPPQSRKHTHECLYILYLKRLFTMYIILHMRAHMLVYIHIYIYIYWKYRGSLKIDNYFLGQIDLKLRQKGWQNHRRNSRNLISRVLWPANLAAEPAVNSAETKKLWYLCRQVVWQSVRSSYGQAKLGQMCRQVARQRMWTCCGQAKIWTFFNCKMWSMQISMKAQSRTCFTVEQGSFLINIFPLIAASGKCEKRFFDCQIATRIADTWQESGTNLAETCALENMVAYSKKEEVNVT